MKNRADLTDDIRGNLRLEHGHVAAFRADHLLPLAWLAEKKKKPVVMVSTRSSAALTVLSSRKSHTPTVKPVVVDNYKHHVNGVDLADQHALYYSSIRKNCQVVEEGDVLLGRDGYHQLLYSFQRDCAQSQVSRGFSSVGDRISGFQANCQCSTTSSCWSTVEASASKWRCP